MPNPKRKHTRSRRDSRRASNWRLSISSLSTCPQCQTMRLPHHICPSCGFYKDRVVIPVKGEKKKEGEAKP